MDAPLSRVVGLPLPPSSQVPPEETNVHDAWLRRWRADTGSLDEQGRMPSDAGYGGRVVLPTLEETAFRHCGWTARRNRVLLSFLRCGESGARVERFLCCGSDAWLEGSASLGRTRIRATLCHDRLCLPCAAERARRYTRNLLNFIGDKTVRFITLTVRHSVDDSLASVIARLVASFRRLRAQRSWKRCVSGGVAFIELKRTVCGWHAHFHMVVEGRWMAQADLRSCWLQATGDSNGATIKSVSDAAKAVAYVCGYAASPLDPTCLETEDTLDECVKSLKGLRLANVFGSWRKHLDLEFRAQTADDWRRITRVCAAYALAASGDVVSHARLLPFAPSSDWVADPRQVRPWARGAP